MERAAYIVKGQGTNLYLKAEEKENTVLNAKLMPINLFFYDSSGV